MANVTLPRVFFEPPFIDNAEAFRLCCYLYAMADESGNVDFSSGDAWLKFKLTPRRFRAIVNLLEARSVARSKTNNKTTSITFIDTKSCEDLRAAKRTTERAAKRAATTNKTSSITLSKPSPELDFVDPLFRDAFSTWIEYKSQEFKERYKTERTLRAAYERLVELSGNDPDAAMRIVKQSMANRWRGLFKLEKNGNKQTTHTLDGREVDQYSELENAANAILRRSADFDTY